MTPDSSHPPEDDSLAASLRGFGPGAMLSMLVIILAGNIGFGSLPAVPAGALLALAWARLSRTPWRALGYRSPRNWIVTMAGGIAFGIVLKILMKVLVMPLLGAAPVNAAYHFLAGNRAMLPAAVWAMLIAGFGEETVFRGYLFERGARLFGCRVVARAVTVLLTSGLFAAMHFNDQGITGVEQAAITGLVFGTIFAGTGSIFFVMFAHAAFDLAALAMIYLDVEAKVAHFVFR